MRCNDSNVGSLYSKSREKERTPGTVQYFQFFPLEIKEKIWKYLNPASIKKVRMVSKSMKEEIERPHFWSWATLRLNQNNQKEVLESALVRLVPGLQVFDSHSTRQLFTAMQKKTDKFKPLVKINIWSSNLRELDPALFLAVGRLRVCHLDNCSLTDDQKATIFSVIQDREDLQLRDLNIWGRLVDMSSLEPGLFRSLVRLESCRLGYTRLTTEQVSAIFSAIQESENLKLRHLNISWNNLSSLQPPLFRSVLSLASCHLGDTRLTPQQVSNIFTAIQETEDLKLQDLNISGVNVSSLEPGLLRSVVRLASCDLSYTRLTPQQVSTIFMAIEETKDVKLRSLNISGIDVAFLEPGLHQSVGKVKIKY